MFVQTQIWRELRVVLHKPSFEEEGAEGIWGDLAKPEVQPILSEVIYFVLLQVGSFGVVQRVGEISSVWLLCLRDLPTLILIPAFIQTKRNKAETNNGSAGLNTGEPKFY